jgi:molecular chaperone DnaJ
MAQKDYYKTLEVTKSANEQDIKSAYRRLARKYHPDTNPDDPASADRFKEVNEAYAVLSDTEKRKKYDRWGADWERYERAGFDVDNSPGYGTGRGSTYSSGGGNSSGNMGGYGDIFDSIFGTKTKTQASPGTSSGTRSSFRVNPTPETDTFGFGRGASARPQRGDDIEQTIEITLEEALQGATRQLQIMSGEVCSVCSGTGLRAGARCVTCSGQGIIQKPKRLEVRIPAGVDEGTKVKVSGEGKPGISGGANGDLLLVVRLVAHPAFTRKGADLYTTASVPLYTALLGGEIIVTSPKGTRFALSVPGETQNGKIFRLAGQGMPVLNGSASARGDLFVKVEIALPTSLSEKEKQLFQQLKQLRPE